MSKTHSDTSEDFEFIETPPAPMPVPPVEDCGVRTTSVSEELLNEFAWFQCADECVVSCHQEWPASCRRSWQ
jgi:hypothetical protein